MSEQKEHRKKSQKLFGEKGSEYHIWIDQYARLYGYRHRQVLHNKEGVEVGIQFFGEKARKHLEQHIKDDYRKDKIPTIEDLRGYPIVISGLIQEGVIQKEKLVKIKGGLKKIKK